MADEIAYQFIPFTAKGDDESRVVEGYVSSGDVDLDQQIVDQGWLKGELPGWLARFGNIREQHRADRAVGRAQAVDLEAAPGPHLAAKIVDDEAWRKVKEGVYTGFSVGIKGPKVVRDAEAKNGRIVGGSLIEISIVDRPANDAARFTLVKRVDGGWRDMQGATPPYPPPDGRGTVGRRTAADGDGFTSHPDLLPREGRRDASERVVADGGDGGAGMAAGDGGGTVGEVVSGASNEGQAAKVGEVVRSGVAPAEVGLLGEGKAAGAAGMKAAGDGRPTPAASVGADGVKAAADVTAANGAPGEPERPQTVLAELEALFSAARARVEALAGQTDGDRDGDVDTGGAPTPDGAAGGARPAADFRATHGEAATPTTETLTLGFRTRADLEKYVGATVEARLRAHGAAQDVLTKAATAAQAVGVETAKLAAQGLMALADETKAVKEELAAVRAAQAATESDLARVKELAQPIKGSVFAVEKGIGLEPDRVNINPDGTSKTATPARGSLEWLARQVAALTEEERTALALTAYRQFAPGGRG